MTNPAALLRDTPRWKIVLWSVAGLAVLKVIVVVEIFMSLLDEAYHKHAYEIRHLLIPHAIFGVIALGCGPLLFSRRIRTRRPVLHRRLGWTYAVCGVVAAPLGAAIAWNGWNAWTFAVTAFAATWIATIALAVFFAVRKRFTEHQRWAVVSYCVAFVFITDRLPLPFEMGPAEPAFLLIQVLLAVLVPQVVFSVQRAASGKR